MKPISSMSPSTTAPTTRTSTPPLPTACGGDADLHVLVGRAAPGPRLQPPHEVGAAPAQSTGARLVAVEPGAGHEAGAAAFPGGAAAGAAPAPAGTGAAAQDAVVPVAGPVRRAGPAHPGSVSCQPGLH